MQPKELKTHKCPASTCSQACLPPSGGSAGSIDCGRALAGGFMLPKGVASGRVPCSFTFACAISCLENILSTRAKFYKQLKLLVRVPRSIPEKSSGRCHTPPRTPVQQLQARRLRALKTDGDDDMEVRGSRDAHVKSRQVFCAAQICACATARCRDQLGACIGGRFKHRLDTVAVDQLQKEGRHAQYMTSLGFAIILKFSGRVQVHFEWKPLGLLLSRSRAMLAVQG